MAAALTYLPTDFLLLVFLRCEVSCVTQGSSGLFLVQRDKKITREHAAPSSTAIHAANRVKYM